MKGWCTGMNLMFYPFCGKDYYNIYIYICISPCHPPQWSWYPPPPLWWGYVVRKGEQDVVYKWWQNAVSVLKDKSLSPPPVVGVCCVEGGTRCSKWWQNIVSVLKDKFSLPPCGGGMLCGGGNNSICVSICCICIFYMCGCICKCKCVCISILH